jgi:Rv2525c-like, glycoside hydrolase-like domain
MAFGVDYSSGNADPAKLKAAGVSFVCRYLSTPGNPKNLTLAEAKRLRAGGLAIVTVFETTRGRALAGRAAGVSDAHSAESQALACGMPPGSPLYFAVDFDATPGQQLQINAYLGGAASVLGWQRVGIYGGYWPVKRALDAGVCKYGWQTYAWSGGQWDPRAQLQQFRNGQRLAGLEVDFDRSLVADFGQWRAAAPSPRPVPPSPPPKPPASIWANLPGPKRKPRWWWRVERILARRRKLRKS